MNPKCDYFFIREAAGTRLEKALTRVRDAWYQITDYNPRVSSPTLGFNVFTLKPVTQVTTWISP